MDLKAKIRDVLKEQYGDFNSTLEHQYEIKLTKTLMHGTIDEKKAWATYNQIIFELKHSLKDMLKVKELQYKLTEDLNPNEVVIEVIEPVKDFTKELERLYYKVKNF